MASAGAIAPLSSPDTIAAAAPPAGAGAASSGLGGSAPAASDGFQAFPASYAGFGTGGTPFGTVGIVGNALAIVTGPGTTAASASSSASSSSANATPGKSDPPANDPPANDPPASDPPTSSAFERIDTIADLQSVNERIAIANGQGDAAAARQLQPFATQLDAQLQDQPFAGLGTTPPQPFASPAIPPVFLDIAA